MKRFAVIGFGVEDHRLQFSHGGSVSGLNVPNAIAVIDPQAVIFVGQTQSAALFIKTLRAKGSYAMVVVNSSVDPKVLVSKLPAAAAIWLAVAEIGKWGNEAMGQ